MNRDYATYWRLSIDDRGWTADCCWDDATWDPTWFVAAKSEDGQWTAEAAIPLNQLTDHAPKAREAWALGVQRVAPGVGFQSWSQPASTAIMPEGFGYLVFE